MLIITGTIGVQSDKEFERVKDALVRRAIRSRADVGNIDYAFCRSLEDSTEIRLVEKWRSEADLNVHLQAPDDEFDQLLATAKISQATFRAHDVTGERVLLDR